jgi:hypothetical protein
MTRYDPLTRFLEAGSGDPITLTLKQVGVLVGGLPESASTSQAWWQNEDPSHTHCQVWRNAGYSAHPDLAQRKVTFRPVPTR